MMQNKEMELWNKLKNSNTNNIKDVVGMMKAVGYTPGEITEMLKVNKITNKKARVDEIKDAIYIRYNMKQKMLFEHVDKNNILSTFSSMREEDRHVIDSLTKLGEIAHSGSGPLPGEGTVPLRLETFVYKAHQEHDATSYPTPQLPEASEEEE